MLGRGTWILCPRPQFPLLLPNSRRTKGHRPGGGRLVFRSLHPSLAGPPLWSVSGEVWCLPPTPRTKGGNVYDESPVKEEALLILAIYTVTTPPSSF